MPPATPAPLDYPYDGYNQPATESPKKDASGAREAAGERPAKNEAPAGTADSAGTSPVPAPVATPSGITVRAESRPGVASSSPVTAAPKSVASLEEAETKKAAESKKDTEVKSETEAKRQPEPVARTAEPQVAKEKQQANEPSRSTVRPFGGATDSLARDKAQSAPSPASGTGVGDGARATTRRRAEDSREEADTRSVAGRKFRKERGIWTDTAYDSSTRTVNMARGSEQFRALVADEPAIGTIAEQLDGEVIVLWKGRAYRIR
ncbi:MAG TPA: hypothetical protein VK893_00240, partial [Pyrinomonadaceae bacterium]|nr:hypothetical protein [Pyrinomonadaceae bacterium]